MSRPGTLHAMRIRPPVAADHAAWLPLWQGYCTFYRETLPPAVTDGTWPRIIAADGAIRAVVAEDGGRLVGFATYLFHPSSWSLGSYCYLEDLFTAEDARGRGVARALIAAVAEAARSAGADRLYWMTHQDNATAQALYDRVAERTGFIQYRKPLNG
jgi:GNAT superfamily N-acetyltransferase